MTKPGKRAAQTQCQQKMEEARRRVEQQAEQQRQRLAQLAGAASNKHFDQKVKERDSEHQRAEQRSVGHVLLSAGDLWAMGIRYSRVQLWKMVKTGRFPSPILISKSRKAWLSEEIHNWIAARAAERTPSEAA